MTSVIGCTDGQAPNSVSPASDANTTQPADAVLAACDHFRTTWVEFAQIYSGPHGLGDTTADPHGVRAQVEVEAAFAAAQRSSAMIQELGARAEGQFEGKVSGDFWDTVAEFFGQCGQAPPIIECEASTACESAGLDRFSERAWAHSSQAHELQRSHESQPS